MKKRILVGLTLAVFAAVSLSSCALAENCQASCNHLYGFEKRVEPTCTSDGRVYHDCIKCFYTEIIETIPKVDHVYTAGWVNQGGCLGYRTSDLCKTCGSENPEKVTYGAFDDSQQLYIHDYDFENPVSVTADSSDPDCAVYEYECKNPDCGSRNKKIKIHKWCAEAKNWYNEHKDDASSGHKFFKCETCDGGYSVYANAWEEGYKVIKSPANESDYAIVGFKLADKSFGRCVKLSCEEFNRLQNGEKITFPMPVFA